MKHEKEIAELREIFNKTPEIQITLPEELGIVSEYLKIPHKALKIIEAQQLEIEALKENYNAAREISRTLATSHLDFVSSQRENAQLKEKLEITTSALQKAYDQLSGRGAPYGEIEDEINVALEQLKKN